MHAPSFVLVQPLGNINEMSLPKTNDFTDMHQSELCWQEQNALMPQAPFITVHKCMKAFSNRSPTKSFLLQSNFDPNDIFRKWC